MNNSLKPSKARMQKQVTRPPQPLTPPEKRRALLVQHLHRLVDPDPQVAKRALQMSQEHLPEMHLISLYEPPNNWVQAVMNSDSMHSLMVQERTPEEMQELMQALLETTDLQSLLEHLP